MGRLPVTAMTIHLRPRANRYLFISGKERWRVALIFGVMSSIRKSIFASQSQRLVARCGELIDECNRACELQGGGRHLRG